MDFKNKILGVFFFLTIIGLAPVSAQQLEISLLTCAPGADLYSAFGHSAIRVREQDTGRDLVFNYGTFDFDTPFFLVKFARRTLDYQLSITTYERFVRAYAAEERNMSEQVLALNPQQAQAMKDFLDINYLPDQRSYRYDFFYDNCATRIRDVLGSILGEQLIWNDPDPAGDERTFRDLIDEYILSNVWADFGIDLALGAVIDVEASPYDAQFLPDYMAAAFARAEIQGDGPTRALVKETRTILPFPPVESSGWGPFNPYLLLWLLAIVSGVMTYLGFKRKRLYIGMDIALFGILGILGIVMFLLWFATDHVATKWNWNLLWAFPGHLILAKGLLAKSLKPWVRKYLLFALIMADAAVVFWILGWQSFHPSLVPLLLVIILRSNYLYYNVDRIKAFAKK